MFVSRKLIVVLLLSSSAACAPSVQEGERSVAVRPSPGVVTSAEIEASGMTNALDVLRRVRPEFLNRRNDAMPSDANRGYPVVYLNGVLQGGVDALESIPAKSVLEIRMLSMVAAAAQLGSTHPGGVIAVKTITARP